MEILFRQLCKWDVITLHRMKSMEQAHCITTRRAHSRSARDIRYGADLDIVMDSCIAEDLARNIVLQLIQMLNSLRFGVLQSNQIVHYRSIRVDEHVLIKTRSADKPAVLLVI